MKLFLMLFLSFSLFFQAFTQDVMWVNDTMKTTERVMTEQSGFYDGFFYLAGHFSDSISNQKNAFKSFGGEDLFISKVSEDGSYKKTVRIGSKEDDYLYGITISNSGDIYVTGAFIDTCDFGGEFLYPKGDYDGFIAKYDKDLTLIWAKNLAYSSTFQFFSTIDIDDNNDLILAGSFIDSLILGSTTLPDTLLSDKAKSLFVAKFNSNGNIIKAIHFPVSKKRCGINNVDINGSNYFFVGKFVDTLFFNNDTVISGGLTDGFTMSIDNNLNAQWIRTIKGSKTNVSYTVDVNSKSEILVGSFFQSLNLQIDSTDTEVSLITPSTKGNSDILITSYALDGTLQWLKTTGSTAADALLNSSLDNDVLFLSGYCGDEIVYDEDTIKNTSGTTDALYLILDAIDGSYINGQAISGPGIEKGYTIQTDLTGLNNQYYLTGTFDSDTIYIGHDTLVNSNVNDNKTDMFIAKYGCDAKIHSQFDIDSITCPTGNDGKLSVFMTINGTDTVDNNWSYKWSNGAIVDSTYDLSEGWYKLTATSEKGCLYGDSTYLTHRRALETFLEDSVTLRCATDTLATAIVTPSYGVPPYQYAWSNGSTDSIATKLIVGLYDVTVTDYCGMASIVVDTIKIGHIPTMNPSLNAYNIVIACKDGNDGNAWVDTTDGVPPYSFQWENSSSIQYKAFDLGVGLHHVTITDQCKSVIDSVNVISLPPLQVRIEDETNISCSGDSTGTATAIAYGGVSPLSYKWTSIKDSTYKATHLAEGINWVTVTDVCGSVTDSVAITVVPSLKVNAILNNPLCYGDANGSIELNIEDGVKPYSIHWSNNEVSSVISNLKEGAYTYTVTDACGDKNKQVAIVAINDPDSIIVQDSLVAETVTGEKDGAIYLDVTGGTTPFVYSWSNNENYQNIENISGGTYTVTISDQNNCTVTKIYTVETTKKSIEIYNTFTPNSDGVNDKWNIKNIDQFPECTVSIFDQWGVKVFESIGYTESWDGTDDGNELPSAVYYYIIDLKDGSRVLQGSVTIIR